MSDAVVLKKIFRPLSIFQADTFTFLVDLYARGGALIPSARATNDKDAGRSNPATGVRTLVQPDGDIITWVPENIPIEEWEAHYARLRAKICAVRQLRTCIRWISTLAGYLTLGQLVYNLYKQPAFWAWSAFEYWPMVVTLTLFSARPILILVFRHLVRHQVSKLWSPAHR